MVWLLCTHLLEEYLCWRKDPRLLVYGRWNVHRDQPPAAESVNRLKNTQLPNLRWPLETTYSTIDKHSTNISQMQINTAPHRAGNLLYSYASPSVMLLPGLRIKQVQPGPYVWRRRTGANYTARMILEKFYVPTWLFSALSDSVYFLPPSAPTGTWRHS